MSKHNRFSVLKLLFCCLFFAAPAGVFGVVVNVPNDIDIEANKEFYVEYNKGKNLWFCMERVTSANIDWWKTRLAYDAYMHFEPPRVLLDRLSSTIRHGRLPSFYSGNPVYMGSPVEPGSEEEIELNARYEVCGAYRSKVESNREYMNLFNKTCDYYYGEGDISGMEKRVPSSTFRYGLTNAIEGFHYNLEHYTDGGSGSTWVAYVSSTPVNGPLYLESSFDIASPAIIMAVTVKISNPFYSPLGIFRSPIAMACGRSEVKNLSMLLHVFVARKVGEIMPLVQFGIFRPLSTMRKIFKSSGIRYTETSNSGIQATTLPCVRFFKLGPLSPIWVIDKSDDKAYEIGFQHWFRRNPFLGGNPNESAVSQYPFITFNRIELGSLSL